MQSRTPALLLQRRPPQVALLADRIWLCTSADYHMDDMTPEMRSRARTNALNYTIEAKGRKAALGLFDEMVSERLADSHQLGVMLSSGEQTRGFKSMEIFLPAVSRTCLALQLATTAQHSARSCGRPSERVFR